MYKEPGTYTKIKENKESEVKYMIALDNKAPITSTDKVWSIKKINDEFSTKKEMTKVNSELETVRVKTENIEININQFPRLEGENTDEKRIQRAINFCKEKNITTLKIAKGEYIIDFAIEVDTPLKIIGEDKLNTILKVKENSTLFHNSKRTDNKQDINVETKVLFRDFHAIFFVITPIFTIKNLTLNGNYIQQQDTVNGVTWNSVSPTIGNGSRKYYKYFSCISIQFLQEQAYDITIDNCKIQNATWNCITVNNNGMNSKGSLNIINNIFDTSPKDVLSIHRVDGVRVYNNSFYNQNSHALHIYMQCKNINVENNYFYSDSNGTFVPPNVKTNELQCIAISHADYNNNYADNITINNNTFNSITDKVTHAIVCNLNVKNIDISNNTVKNFINAIIFYNFSTTSTKNIFSNTFIDITDCIVFRPTNALGATTITLPNQLVDNTIMKFNIQNNNNIGDNTNFIDYRLNTSVNYPSQIKKYEVFEKDNKGEFIVGSINEKTVLNFYTCKAKNDEGSKFFVGDYKEITEHYQIKETIEELTFAIKGRNGNSVINKTVEKSTFLDLKNINILKINSNNSTPSTFETLLLESKNNEIYENGIYSVEFYAKSDNNSSFSLGARCQGYNLLPYRVLSINSTWKKFKVMFYFDKSINASGNTYKNTIVEFNASNESDFTIKNLCLADIKIKKY